MKILLPIALILHMTLCGQDEVQKIKLEMKRIDQLTDTLHHLEIEEDWNTGRIEDNRIMYLIDKDSTIRKIKFDLRLGTSEMDTLHEHIYYYKNDQVLFISIRETINTSPDTVTVHDCNYYFRDQNLASTSCLTGEPEKEEHLLTAARFTLTAVEQLMRN